MNLVNCVFHLVLVMEEDEFSQGFILPPLITQLRKILDQYPDDTQILKVSHRCVCIYVDS